MILGGASQYYQSPFEFFLPGFFQQGSQMGSAFGKGASQAFSYWHLARQMHQQALERQMLERAIEELRHNPTDLRPYHAIAAYLMGLPPMF